jgi:hypothetical protein
MVVLLQAQLGAARLQSALAQTDAEYARRAPHCSRTARGPVGMYGAVSSRKIMIFFHFFSHLFLA